MEETRNSTLTTKRAAPKAYDHIVQRIYRICFYHEQNPKPQKINTIPLITKEASCGKKEGSYSTETYPILP